MVPKEWIAPPDHETADGELLDPDEFDEEDEDEYADENAGLVTSDRKRQQREEQERGRLGGGASTPPARVVNLTRDSEGRELPAAERAPLPAAWRS